jgi:hypothetical protein
MSDAQDTLEDEVEQQRAAGKDYSGRAEEECTVCGEMADVFVAARNAPADGAAPMADYTRHVDDGDTFYHRDD